MESGPNAADEVADAWGDAVVEALNKFSLDAAIFKRAYDLVVERRVVTPQEFARGLGITLKSAHAYLRVLMDHEDVYASAVEDGGRRPKLHYCYAPGALALLCQRRKISLARFLKLTPVLERFMADVEVYYVHRMMQDRSGRVKISKLKREYTARLQPMVSPRTPLSTWSHPVTTHPAWRYVRTAQDLVLLKLDIPRPFVDGAAGGDPRTVRLKDGREVRLSPPRVVRLGDGRARCEGCDIILKTREVARHLLEHRKLVLRAAKRSPAWIVIRCKDCGEARAVSTKDAFQVKRCVACQGRYRRDRARVRRKRTLRLALAPPSRRGAKLREVTKTPAKEKKAKPAAPKTVTIKCADCGKPRTIKPQDVFQVKRCPEHQKQYRLLRAKERRAAKHKGQKPKAKKAAKPKPKVKKAAPAAPAAPAAEPAPAPG